MSDTDRAPFSEDPDEAHEELHPILDSIEQLEKVVGENERTIKTALSSLRTTVLEHYARTMKRLDEQAKEIRRIKVHVGLTDPEPPGDGL